MKLRRLFLKYAIVGRTEFDGEELTASRDGYYFRGAPEGTLYEIPGDAIAYRVWAELGKDIVSWLMVHGSARSKEVLFKEFGGNRNEFYNTMKALEREGTVKVEGTRVRLRDASDGA